MSLDGLSNPLERAGILSGMMNYRQQWVTGTQYYVNDVVTSPSDGQLYMLALRTLLSNQDPATITGVSPWVSFAGSVSGGNPMDWQGTWSALTTYYQGAVVQTTTDKKAYVLTATSSLNQEPSANSPATWSVLDALPGPAFTTGTFSASYNAGPQNWTVTSNVSVDQNAITNVTVPFTFTVGAAPITAPVLIGGFLQSAASSPIALSSLLVAASVGTPLAPNSTISFNLSGTVRRSAAGSGTLSGAIAITDTAATAIGAQFSPIVIVGTPVVQAIA